MAAASTLKTFLHHRTDLDQWYQSVCLYLTCPTRHHPTPPGVLRPVQALSGQLCCRVLQEIQCTDPDLFVVFKFEHSLCFHFSTVCWDRCKCGQPRHPGRHGILQTCLVCHMYTHVLRMNMFQALGRQWWMYGIALAIARPFTKTVQQAASTSYVSHSRPHSS